MQTTLALKGNLVYTPVCGELAQHPDSYLVCENGTVAGVFDVLPERYRGIPVEDYGDKLILPGFVDLHVHAGQYAYRGFLWMRCCTAPPPVPAFLPRCTARRRCG